MPSRAFRRPRLGRCHKTEQDGSFAACGRDAGLKTGAPNRAAGRNSHRQSRRLRRPSRGRRPRHRAVAGIGKRALAGGSARDGRGWRGSVGRFPVWLKERRCSHRHRPAQRGETPTANLADHADPVGDGAHVTGPILARETIGEGRRWPSRSRKSEGGVRASAVASRKSEGRSVAALRAAIGRAFRRPRLGRCLKSE